MSRLMNDTVVPRAGNQNRWTPLILIVAAVLLYFAVRRPATDLSDWGGDLDHALREASNGGLPVLVAFYMPGCVPCSIMDRTVLSDSDVKRALHDYVRVRLDATEQTDLARQYEVYATPTFTVVDSEGRLLSQREGTLTVEEFVQFLNRAARLLSPPRPAHGGSIHPSPRAVLRSPNAQRRYRRHTARRRRSSSCPRVAASMRGVPSGSSDAKSASLTLRSCGIGAASASKKRAAMVPSV